MSTTISWSGSTRVPMKRILGSPDPDQADALIRAAYQAGAPICLHLAPNEVTCIDVSLKCDYENATSRYRVTWQAPSVLEKTPSWKIARLVQGKPKMTKVDAIPLTAPLSAPVKWTYTATPNATAGGAGGSSNATSYSFYSSYGP